MPASTVGLHDDYWINFFLGANDGKNSSHDLFGHGLILDKSELIAQRLSAEPKGNSMKHAKQGPREFVPFEYSEITLENIKRACKVRYRENLIYSHPSKDHLFLAWIKFQASRSFMFALSYQSLGSLSLQKR